MMIDLYALGFSVAAGLGAGTVYFMGLWWTVNRLKISRRPAVLTLGSFALRAVLVLAVFYLVAQGHWARFLGCMVGFLAARTAITRRLRPEPTEAFETLTTGMDG